jgi:hypothetical protein
MPAFAIARSLESPRYGLADYGLARYDLADYGLARYDLADYGLARYDLARAKLDVNLETATSRLRCASNYFVLGMHPMNTMFVIAAIIVSSIVLSTSAKGQPHYLPHCKALNTV